MSIYSKCSILLENENIGTLHFFLKAEVASNVIFCLDIRLAEVNEKLVFNRIFVISWNFFEDIPYVF